MQYYWKLHKHTSIHCSFSCLRIIGVWYSVGWSIIADQKIDCCLKRNYWLVFYFKNIYIFYEIICCLYFWVHIKRWKLTPIFCPLSLTRGTFLHGSDLAWPEARSLKEILADPRNLLKKQTNSVRQPTFLCIQHSTWGTLPGDHSVSMSWLNQAKYVLPFYSANLPVIRLHRLRKN